MARTHEANSTLNRNIEALKARTGLIEFSPLRLVRAFSAYQQIALCRPPAKVAIARARDLPTNPKTTPPTYLSIAFVRRQGVVNMHRQNLIALASVVLVLTAVVTVSYAKGLGPFGLLHAGVRSAIGRNHIVASDTLAAEKSAPAAPEISTGTWMNSEPLTLKSLHGRVVLVDFWTFACYNCRNTLPFVKRWHERYADKGLTVIGVHSPELDEERNLDNVRREVASLGIQYPVVTDNDFANWKAYDVEGWPTMFLIDKAGRIRWMHIGEGAYDEAEQTIQELLAEPVK
jgi:thiol-disulfide isomerase/thioredoxin